MRHCLLLLLLPLMACPPVRSSGSDDDDASADDDDTTPDDDDVSTDDDTPDVGQVQLCASIVEPRAEVTGWRADGDWMLVEAWRSGGCEEWTYSLCWDGAFAESWPVQVWLTLQDEGPPDPCEAEVEELLEFNLQPLRQAYQDAYGDGGGTIIVHLDGVTQEWSF